MFIHTYIKPPMRNLPTESSRELAKTTNNIATQMTAAMMITSITWKVSNQETPIKDPLESHYNCCCYHRHHHHHVSRVAWFEQQMTACSLTAVRYRVLAGSKEGDTQTHTAGAGRDGAGRQSRLAGAGRAESARACADLSSRGIAAR